MKIKSNLVLVYIVFILFLAFFYVYKSKENLNNLNQSQNQNIKEPSKPDKKVVETITEKECKEHVYFLASDDLEGRMSGKKGNVKAAEYIKSEFESYGLPTMYDKFKISRVNLGPKDEKGDNFTQNIYAWIEGQDPVLKNEIIVIGAHMDHIGYGPKMSRSKRIAIHNGADDNASGTSALLEIAEAMSKLKLKRTVVFQAYSGEEMGLLGSKHYVENPKFPQANPDIKKHVAMINTDMVGFLNQGYYQASFLNANSSVDITNNIEKLNEKYKFAKKITARGGGGSDHACFYNKKIPVAFLHTGGNKYYHTPEDDPERLNYKGLEMVAKYAFELCFNIAQEENPPEFNLSSFKKLPLKHDHGHSDMSFEHYHEH